MKFLLPLLIFLSGLLAPSVFAQGLCSGGTVILKDGPFIVKIPGSGREIFTGDWGSSGDTGGIEMSQSDMMPTFRVDLTPFKYLCQLQITDQIEKSDATLGRYMTLAMAQFEFDETNTIRHSDDLNWTGKRFYFGTGTAVDETDPIPFSLKNHSASIVFIDKDPNEDQVQLTVKLSQPLGNSSVTETATLTYLRSAKNLFVEKALNVSGPNGAIGPRYMAKLYCEKKL